MRLILFDIDGTLLWTNGAGRRAIHRALLDEMGTAGPIDGYRFDGKTDPQIVRGRVGRGGPPGSGSGRNGSPGCANATSPPSAPSSQSRRRPRSSIPVSAIC